LKLGVSKKTEKPIKPRKQKKTNRKNRLKFKKNQLVRFYKPETKKTKPKPKKNKKKPSQTGFCSKKPNRTETGRFEPVLVFFLISVWLFFLIKTEPNRK